MVCPVCGALCFSVMGKSSAGWRDRAKCAKLSISESDQLFFPGPGGKSKAAAKFCEGCPVVAECLNETLALGGVGFWAGTTEGERERMIKFLGLMPAQLDTVPEEVPRRRKLRNIPAATNILDDPLYGVEGPSELELADLSRYGM